MLRGELPYVRRKATVCLEVNNRMFRSEAGRSVRLDGFGTFSLHVAGEGKDSPDKVTKRDITKVKMAFLPSKDIKRILAATEFRKV